MRVSLLLCCLFFVPALARCGDEVVGARVSQISGALYTFDLTRSSLTKAPRWEAGADSPPLSPRKAQEIALAQAKSLCPEVTHWNLSRISLEPTGQDSWIYLVTYQDLSKPIGGIPPFLALPIYFDGTTITPTIKKFSP